MREQRSTPSIFISYSHEDAAFVDWMRADLDKHGIASWFDRSLQPGTPDWEEALREQIRIAHAVLLIASPHARKSRYVKDELRLAEMYCKLVYPLWVAGEEWIDSIPLGLGGWQYVDVREKNKYDAELPSIVTALREASFNTNQLAIKQKAWSKPLVQVPGSSEPRNPYKGLLAFTEKDVTDFFGRETLVHDLLSTLENVLDAERKGDQSARFLAVLGASGLGKSSVIMAGLPRAISRSELQSSMIVNSGSRHGTTLMSVQYTPIVNSNFLDS